MPCSKIITKYDEFGSLVLDNDAVYEMMTRLAERNRRFAIISIAGEMRTGKSFLLNFLIRCLRNGGPTNPEWIGGKETSVNEGIAWRGGPKPETTGIHVWDEIFTLSLKDGEKISILLMDTQGLFDTDTVAGNNVKLFTLSTLASSVQIFNLQKQIIQTDLDHLQLFVDYSRAAAGEGLRDFQLQDLLILVRDWQNADDYPYGREGGMNYLKSVLKPEGKGEKEGEDMKTSFKRLECFVMPHPGLNVSRKSFKGVNQDLDKDFLNCVQTFTNHLLDPDNLALKTMQATELGNFLMACGNSFASGKVPSATNIVEATAKVFWSNTYEECLKSFKQDLESEFQLISKTQEELVDIFNKAKQKALTDYDDRAFSSFGIRAVQREHLIRQCEKEYEIFKDMNNNRKADAQLQIESILQMLVDEYKEILDKRINDKTTETDNLELFHTEYYRTAIKSFEEWTEQYSTLAKQFEGKLREKLEEVFAKMKKENERSTDEKEVPKKENELTIYQFKENLLIKYKTDVKEQLLKKYTPTEWLEKQLDKKMQEILEEFDGKFKGCDEYTQLVRKVLEEDLKIENTKSLKSNNKNKKKILRLTKMEHKANLLKFRSCMTEFVQSAYIDPERLKQRCNEIYGKNKASFEEKLGVVKSDSDFEMLLKEIENDYKSAIDDIMADNESNKPRNNRRLENVPYFVEDEIDLSLIRTTVGGIFVYGLAVANVTLCKSMGPAMDVLKSGALELVESSVGAYVVKRAWKCFDYVKKFKRNNWN